MPSTCPVSSAISTGCSCLRLSHINIWIQSRKALLLHCYLLTLITQMIITILITFTYLCILCMHIHAIKCVRWSENNLWRSVPIFYWVWQQAPSYTGLSHRSSLSICIGVSVSQEHHSRCFKSLTKTWALVKSHWKLSTWAVFSHCRAAPSLLCKCTPRTQVPQFRYYLAKNYSNFL